MYNNLYIIKFGDYSSCQTSFVWEDIIFVQDIYICICKFICIYIYLYTYKSTNIYTYILYIYISCTNISTHINEV